MKTFYKSIQKEFIIRLLIYISISILAIDTIYRSINGITYLTRERCILNQGLPHWSFLLYENFVELFLLVIVGVFVAALLEKYFSRFQRFIPQNPVTAFLYASVIPLCSCSAVPLISTMNEKLPFRTIMTFVLAAPLLNPYIIMLSVTVLGIKYALLRIIASMILAISSGYIVEYFYKRMHQPEIGRFQACEVNGNCSLKKSNVYETTFSILKKTFIYIIIAGFLGIIIELSSPGDLLKNINLNNNFLGTAIVVLIGVPVYFCNGADVMFLQPLIKHSHLPLGTAIAFSLTSTSVCITSLVLLFKFIGKKLTLITLSCIILLTFLLSLIIQKLEYLI